MKATIRGTALATVLIMGCARGGGSNAPLSLRFVTGDDRVASGIVLRRGDVPADWRQHFDPPSVTNLDRRTRRCFGAVGARASGHFAGANYLKDEMLMYSFVDAYRSTDEAARAFELFDRETVPRCMLMTDEWLERRDVEAFGDQTARIRFANPDPYRHYFDLTVARRGHFVLFLTHRNRTGPFPKDLHDRMLRKMLARVPE